MKESAPKSGYPKGEDHPEDAGSSTLISRAFVPPCIPMILTTVRTASLGPDILEEDRNPRRILLV
jgi:hypothetical protein